MNVNEKLLRVREQMNLLGLDAFIVLSEDPHGSEYPANYWRFREFLSDFNGSAGVLVITQQYVGLWTDSRYHLQAEKQLRGTSIELHKMGLPGIPDPVSYLTYILPSGSIVGIDGFTISYDRYRKMVDELEKFGISVNYKVNIIDEVFAPREPLPLDELVEVPSEFVSQSRREHIAQVRQFMEQRNITHYLVSALDDIAWFLNLRGSDVQYNPVFYAYMIITMNEVNLYIDPHKLSTDVYRQLEKDGVVVSLYAHYEKNLSNLPTGSRVFYNPKTANARNIMSLPKSTIRIEDVSVIETLKACKTHRDLQMIQDVHVRDGVAMVKFMYWLDQTLKRGDKTSELEVVSKLHDFRAEQKNYLGESFATIAAYDDNGAIVHYTPHIETNRTIDGSDRFLLIDSGAHYHDGTTDITRTIAIGSELDWSGDKHSMQRSDYTLVLKGHINLARAVFPVGTTGIQLDTLARVFLWKSGKDYGHGSGHGVGFNLNVHEGPQSISKSGADVALAAGMVQSDEPGLYREGKYGIRIENMIYCESVGKVDDFGDFLRFRTLTLCPYDRKAIDVDLLTDEEIVWINNYHRRVFDTLSPHLNEEEYHWLSEATRPLSFRNA